MRLLSPIALLLLSVPAFAETLSAPSTVTAVTVYADAAQVTRQVTLNVPQGHHSLTITDLPYAADARGLRIDAPDGISLGALSLRDARLLPSDQAESPEVAAAKAALQSARAALVQARAAQGAVQAEVDAAEARADFYGRIKADAGPDIGVDALKAIADVIGAETLAAKQAALAAMTKLPAAEAAVADAEAAVADAEAALAAAAPEETDGKQLTAVLDAATAGAVTLTVTHLVEGAYWRPAYDLSLTRGDTPSLVLDRGAFVSQDSGEDWRGVDLTLSSAQLSSQMAPSELWGEPRRIGQPQDERAYADDAGGMMEPEVMAAAAPMIEAETVTSDDLVLYHFPQPIDVATGAEDVRVALDRIDLSPEVEARAVPAIDQTAFQVARFVNPTAEVLIAGDALLIRDGAVIGSTALERLAPGQETEVGFGPIEGLRLKAGQPDRAEGDSGIIVKSNRQDITTVYIVQNLTGRDWTVRMLETVPYSEQEDLDITVTADPAPSETDVDDTKGLWAWSLDVASGAEAKVSVTESLAWPDGMELLP